MKSDRWSIIACDVGQGDAYIVQKGRFQLLIDTGPSLEKLLICLERYMPIFDKSIDAVLITHADFDHYGGFVGLESYYVIHSVYHNIFVDKSDYRYDYFLTHLMNNVIVGRFKYSIVNNDLKFAHSDGMFSFALANNSIIGRNSDLSDSNKQSVITTFKSTNMTALFTADSDYQLLNDLLSHGYIYISTSDVLFMSVPHHGSKTGLSDNVLYLLNPEYCVISVGKNSYGHPHFDTLRLLQHHKCATYNTNIDSSVEFIF